MTISTLSPINYFYCNTNNNRCTDCQDCKGSNRQRCQKFGERMMKMARGSTPRRSETGHAVWYAKLEGRHRYARIYRHDPRVLGRHLSAQDRDLTEDAQHDRESSSVQRASQQPAVLYLGDKTYVVISTELNLAWGKI